MTSGISSNTALTGLRAATRTLGNSAHQTANATTPGFRAGATALVDDAPGVRAVTDPGGQDPAALDEPSNVSIGREAVTQMAAQSLYRANLASIRTEDEVLGQAIDIKR